MKKVICFAFLITGLSVGSLTHTARAQGKEPRPPAQLQANFAHDYASAENIVWSASPRYQKATFAIDNVPMTAFYNRQNEYVATTQLVEVTQLYPGYQMGQIIKCTGSQDAYFINLRNEKENFLVIITADANVNYFKDLK